jgi:hypothetical protein
MNGRRGCGGRKVWVLLKRSSHRRPLVVLRTLIPVGKLEKSCQSMDIQL